MKHPRSHDGRRTRLRIYHHPAGLVAVLAALALFGPWVGSPALAQGCTEAQIAAAQDEGSAALRKLNAASTPQIDAKMRELQKARGWSDHDLDDKAYEQLEDATIRAFDGEMTTLITRMETLSEPSTATPACERLVELRQTLDRMREIALQKSRYMLAKLDRELSGAAAPAPGPVGSAGPAVAAPAAPPAAPKTAAKIPDAKPTDLKPANPPAPWTTTTRVEPSMSREAPPGSQPPGPPSPQLPQTAALPPVSMSEPQTYAREEIFAAGEGVFGKVSSSLASVLDFAFQKAGRPSGYIVGDEGGAAFLAGVRYGKGMLYLKGQTPQIVHWRGPSIGYDVGAAGSRLMVLVYNVKDPEDLYANFAGVDGSAYLVGGLGMTFLTNGKKLMAPIRSGIGLRLGANIGYLKFSHRPSWNPF